MDITEEMALRVLSVIDQGLCKGLGMPTPGKMCVEAAVCYALGEPHSDQPSCVSPALRKFKTGLNDACWSSNAARASGLRRIAIAQLGTSGTLDEQKFVAKLGNTVIRKLLPKVLRSEAAIQQEPHKSTLLEAANRCEMEGTAAAAHTGVAAALAPVDTAFIISKLAIAGVVAEKSDAAGSVLRASYAYQAAASYHARVASDFAEALDAAAADQWLSEFAEEVVQILVEMETPGSDYLFLTGSAS